MLPLSRVPDGTFLEGEDGGPWLRIGDLWAKGTGDDLASALALRPLGIWLPGCVGAADLQHLGARLAVAEAECDLPDGSTRIIASASDTAAGVLALDRLPGASQRLAGLVWDEAALGAALGPEADDGALRHARARTILTAAACGVPVYRLVDSAAALRQEA